MKSKQIAATCQVERGEPGYEAFTVWIVESGVGNSELKAFRQKGVLDLHTDLHIVNTVVVSHICFDPDVIDAPRLSDCLCLIREWVGTWEVFDDIKSVERADCHQKRWAERVHIPWSNVDRVNQLTLILSECFLVERVCYLKTVSGEVEIQVKRVAGRRVIVEMVKDCHRLTLIVKSSEFRWIEKATRAFKIKCRKIADLLVSKSKSCLLLSRAKRAVHGRNASKWSGNP